MVDSYIVRKWWTVANTAAHLRFSLSFKGMKVYCCLAQQSMVFKVNVKAVIGQHYNNDLALT